MNYLSIYFGFKAERRIDTEYLKLKCIITVGDKTHT